MTRLYVPLSDREFEALRRLAYAEKRRPQDQASVLIAEALVSTPSEREANGGTPSPERAPQSQRSSQERERVPA